MANFDSDLILDRLQALHPKSIDLSLDRLERLLTQLGHPERRVAPVVHIAGTNGKGSTLAMLDAMLHSAGRRVQRYISPHLVHFAERMLFDGQPIGDAPLADVLDITESVNGGAPITFFEITTAAAFLAFARRPADILLLETGLGGRLDATNVIEVPRLTVLAPISLDHQSFLGDSLTEIAAEKAGIMKPGVPCVVGPQEPEALAVIRARAEELDVPLQLYGRDWMVRRVGDRLRMSVARDDFDLPLPALFGCHQVDNAGLAVACALALADLAPDGGAIAGGLRDVHWPGRLQRLHQGPLPQHLPPGWELWLDGGHNPAAADALAASLSGVDAPLHLIVGMLKTKDERGFLQSLMPLVQSVHTVPVPGEPASHDPATAAAEARSLGLRAASAADVATALRTIAEIGRRPARVLICGSLYLAGHVLRTNG